MIFSEQHNKILDAAIDVWGVSDQKAMAVGECGEYLSLVGKEAQGRATEDDWISEIVDVMIMMEQMARMRDYEKVRQVFNYKMSRLKERLERHGVQFD